MKMYGILLSLFLGIATTANGVQPPQVRDPDAVPITPPVGLSAAEAEQFFLSQSEGVPLTEINILNRISPSSLGEHIHWQATKVQKELSLSDRELEYFQKALDKRRSATKQNLRTVAALYQALRSVKPSELLAIQRKYVELERQSEKTMFDDLDEVLSPRRMNQLTVWLIRYNELNFGEIEFVRNRLGVTPEQTKAFQKAGRLLAERSAKLVAAGRDPTDMTKETDVWNVLFEAVDMLDNRQFEFYLMAKGVIPEGSSLRETIKLGDEKALKMIGIYSPKRDLSKLDDVK